MALKSVIGFSAIAVFLLSSSCFGVEGDYVSSYGDGYRVRITKTGDVFRVRWDLPDGSHWVGVGLLNEKGDTFTVASVVSKGQDDQYVNGSLHVSVYKVERRAK